MLKTCTKGKLRERERIFGAAGAINIGEITFNEKPVSGGGKSIDITGHYNFTESISKSFFVSNLVTLLSILG